MKREAIALGLLLGALFDQVLPAQDLATAVETYLSEAVGSAADDHLKAILLRPDASSDAILDILRAAPKKKPESAAFDLRVPYLDQHLLVKVAALAALQPSEGRPVLLDISNNIASYLAPPPEVIVAEIPKYTPPEFSDEGRDGFLKVLHTVAHAAGGDPDQLWTCGFSWAGHASYDTALHRPWQLAGILPSGGGPRRVHYRLRKNLRGVRILAACGAKDDPELVWNLKELSRLAVESKLDYRLELDDEKGHSLPLRGMEHFGALIPSQRPGDAIPPQGTMLADAPNVESPFLRILEVDAAMTTVPARVPVPSTLSEDAKRRQTIKAMDPKVAKLGWKIEEAKDATTITLVPEGVLRASVILRTPKFTPGRKLLVRCKGKTLFERPVPATPEALLREARRTGNRLRPAFAVLEFDLPR